MARGPFTDFVVGQNDELILNADDHVWLTVGRFSVKVVHYQDGSARVKVYPKGYEDSDPIRFMDIF